ncbi:MAG: adenylate/guanylate cyclase domain-containing protein, partial [Rhodospirillaceae bacterium]
VANTFAEAKTAIESLSDRIFMAVTAMFLTDADGLEVVDHLLAKNLPCVVLTASHDEGLRSQSRSKPILDYFLKSTLYDDRRLFDLIRRTFENDLTTVLAVDDSRTDLHLVTDLLKSMNFRVLSATSGDEALGILAGDPSIRIVVTDNDMPGMNGIDFTAELRRRLGDEDMIVIGMSSAVDVTARFLKAGCNDFIKKPFSAEEFYCRIQQNVQFFDKFVETKRLNARVSHEKAQSEKLLRNILPERVAAELKACGRVEPVSHESVSVLFADFVGFTHNAENLASAKLLEILVYYYGRFDDIVSQLWLEKIKTIGDCYMCVAGLASETENHAEEAVNAARAMMAAVENPPPGLFDDGMESWKLRIGIHSGPVTAGVVGTHNFAYDIWGDTVNTAARVEAVGDAWRINVSEATHALLPQNVAVEPRGHIPIKGKASLGMFFVA